MHAGSWHRLLRLFASIGILGHRHKLKFTHVVCMSAFLDFPPSSVRVPCGLLACLSFVSNLLLSSNFLVSSILLSSIPFVVINTF